MDQPPVKQNKMSCCEKFLKITLFVSNLAVLLAGVGLITVSSFVIALFRSEFGFRLSGPTVSFNITPLAVAVIVVGSLLTVLGAAGCFLAKEKPRHRECLHTVYLIFVPLTMAACIVIAVFGVTNEREHVLNALKSSMDYAFTHVDFYSGGLQTAIVMQETLQCCGANNFTDWRKVNVDSLPDSCCKQHPCPFPDESFEQPDVMYNLGCKEAIENNFWLTALYSFTTYAVVIVIQLIACITTNNRYVPAHNTSAELPHSTIVRPQKMASRSKTTGTTTILQLDPLPSSASLYPIKEIEMTEFSSQGAPRPNSSMYPSLV